MTINAIIHEAEEGGYWAEVPSLPGCLTEGETMEQIQTNLRRAIQGWMEAAENRSRQLLDSNSVILALAV